MKRWRRRRLPLFNQPPWPSYDRNIMDELLAGSGPPHDVPAFSFDIDFRSEPAVSGPRRCIMLKQGVQPAAPSNVDSGVRNQRLFAQIPINRFAVFGRVNVEHVEA